MDDQYLRTRWETRIKPLVFADVLAANNPVTIFLGGQPGAGKTQGKNYALAQFPPDTVAEIIGDDFRRHHPDYVSHYPRAFEDARRHRPSVRRVGRYVCGICRSEPDFVSR